MHAQISTQIGATIKIPQMSQHLCRTFFSTLLLLGGVVPRPGRAVDVGLAEVNTEWPAVDDLSVQRLLRHGGTLDVNEVSVGEASGLAGPAVDSDTDINDVANVAEKVVQVLVRHLERHVADEEGLGRGVGGVCLVAVLPALLGLVELADQVAALEDLHIEVLNGRLGVLNALVLDVSESVECQFLIDRVVIERTHPRLNPLLSKTILTSTTSPNRPKTRLIWSAVTS